MGSLDIPMDAAGIASVFGLQWLGLSSFAGLVLLKFEPWAYPHFYTGPARSCLIMLLIQLCHLGFFVLCCSVYSTVPCSSW
jgi:hypothetical protein